MPETCNITFSSYIALADLPAHDVVATHRYHVSDQTFESAAGVVVRFIARPFIATENRSFDNPDLLDLVAGHCYLKFESCVVQASDPGDCELGACIRGDVCCDLKTEPDCLQFIEGEWLGLGTSCELPPCDLVVCCINAGNQGCIVTTPDHCVNLWAAFGGQAGQPIHDLLTCEDCIGACCRGACCIHLGATGVICITDTNPWECANPIESGILLPQDELFWPTWMGRYTCCPSEPQCVFSGTEGEYIECPTTVPCCPPIGENDLDCEDLEPHVCLEMEGVLGIPGQTCSSAEGICNGACCITQLDNQGKIIGGFCLDVSFDECVLAGSGNQFSFLGPGTSCDDNAGDCGICCKYDSDTDSFICVEDLTQSECLEQCGRPFGPGSQCDICEQQKMACCLSLFSVPGDFDIPPDPPPGGFIQPPRGPEIFEFPICQGPFECIEVSSRAECVLLDHGDQSGRFEPCVTCGSAPCSGIAGACCTALVSDPELPDVGICICTNETRESCSAGGGVFYGEATACCGPGEPQGPLPICCVKCPDFGGSATGCGIDSPPPPDEDGPCVPPDGCGGGP